MKRLMMIAVALALVTTAAHADDAEDARVSTGIATMMAYDLKCEKVPVVFTNLMYDTLKTVSTAAFKAATEKVLAFYKSAGPAAYCAANKPLMDRAMAAYRD